MCRNIKPLFNYEPPVSEEEIRQAAMQYIRKVSGFPKPSRANQQAFDSAVERVAAATADLLSSLETAAPRRIRQVEVLRARKRAAIRYSSEDRHA